MRRLLTLVLLVSAVPLLADSHRVLEVQFHSRIPATILSSQSMLEENRDYTDQELQLAMARLRRLPFVYAARYIIEGSTLVVDVAGETRVFYDVDTLGQSIASGGGGAAVIAEVGGRYETPWGGVVGGAVGRSADTGLARSAWTANYSQYGLAGTPFYATLALTRGMEQHNVTPRVEVGYALTLRQTIAASFARDWLSRGDPDAVAPSRGQGVFQRHGLRTAALRWRWDTTNDPLFADRGLLIAAGPSVSKQEDTFRAASQFLSFDNDQRARTTDWNAAAQSYWPLSARGTVTAAASFLASNGRLDDRSSTFTLQHSTIDNRQVAATVGYAFNFFRSLDAPGGRRNRAEVSAGLVRYAYREGLHNDADLYRTAAIAYLFRNRVGSIRIALTYLDLNR